MWDDRYHSQPVTNLAQMRNTLVYVLHNAKHHGEQLPNWANGIDPYSSAYYFDGWDNDRFRDGLDPPDDDLGPPVAPMCRVLPIAPSTYYAHKAVQRDPTVRSDRAKRDEQLGQEVQRVWCPSWRRDSTN